MIWIMFAGEAFSSSVAVAPKRSGNIARSAKPKGEGQRWRAYEDIVRCNVKHFARIAIGDDQKISMKMHGRLRLPSRARREAEQGNIIAPG